MPPILLRDSLKRIEEHKLLSPHYRDILDILGEILILREEYRMVVDGSVFSVNEALIDVKLRGGLPVVDIPRDLVDSTAPERYFKALVAVAERYQPEESADSFFLDGACFSYRELISSIFTGDTSSSRFETTAEEEEHILDLVGFLVEESLRPALEAVVDCYGNRIRTSGWDHGYCPVCGREPKIGKLTDDGQRLLFCNQCGFEWPFKKEKCPFCGNEDERGLACFLIEDEEQYHVDVCNRCKRYVKTVELPGGENDTVNMDVEDITTLHLDILANEEGYD